VSSDDERLLLGVGQVDDLNFSSGRRGLTSGRSDSAGLGRKREQRARRRGRERTEPARVRRRVEDVQLLRRRRECVHLKEILSHSDFVPPKFTLCWKVLLRVKLITLFLGGRHSTEVELHAQLTRVCLTAFGTVLRKIRCDLTTASVLLR